MMINEFIDRTGYTPRDVFCKEWLKAKKSGKWDLELKFRKAIDEQKAEYEKKIAEQEEYLNFYRKEFENYFKLKSQMRAITEIANNRDFTHIHSK